MPSVNGTNFVFNSQWRRSKMSWASCQCFEKNLIIRIYIVYTQLSFELFGRAFPHRSCWKARFPCLNKEINTTSIVDSLSKAFSIWIAVNSLIDFLVEILFSALLSPRPKTKVNLPILWMLNGYQKVCTLCHIGHGSQYSV